MNNPLSLFRQVKAAREWVSADLENKFWRMLAGDEPVTDDAAGQFILDFREAAEKPLPSGFAASASLSFALCKVTRDRHSHDPAALRQWTRHHIPSVQDYLRSTKILSGEVRRTWHGYGHPETPLMRHYGIPTWWPDFEQNTGLYVTLLSDEFTRLALQCVRKGSSGLMRDIPDTPPIDMETIPRRLRGPRIETWIKIHQDPLESILERLSLAISRLEPYSDDPQVKEEIASHRRIAQAIREGNSDLISKGQANSDSAQARLHAMQAAQEAVAYYASHSKAVAEIGRR